MDKIALVTGSGKKRVGHAIALELAQAGYDIVVHCHKSVDEAKDTADQLKSMGRRAVVLPADLTAEKEVDHLFECTMEAYGRLDVLVCSAATWGKAPLEETTARMVDQEWRTNTLSTFLCCQKAGLIMANQKHGGSIVTIGDWAIARPYADHSAYFASKGTIPTMTRTFAVELARRNPSIRVNCVLPGPVMLPDDLPEDEKRAAIDATLVKREGSPRHVAQAVRFFVENDFVTGVCLPVDGGRTIYAPDC